MRYRRIVLFLVFTVVFLSSCSDNKNYTDCNTSYDAFMTFLNNSTEDILLIDRFTGVPVMYNTEKKALKEKMQYDNFFAYNFDDDSTYFTAGDSMNLGFKLYKKAKGKVEKILDFDNCGVFPVTENDEKMYFIVSYYNPDMSIDDSTIMSIDKETLEKEIFSETVNGMVSDAAIAGDKLFYTVYNIEKDVFEFYSLDLESSDITYIKNLENAEVYSQGEEVYIVEDGHLISQGKKFLHKTDNFFIGGKILLQYSVNSNEELIATAIDTETGESIYKGKNPIDFEIVEGELRIYRDGGIDTIKLS